jgi:leucyl-tRNA synthetase
MGVPKHDERDMEFAKKYKIPVEDRPLLHEREWKKFGKSTVNYRLHDWSVSRQRYWGAPIPIIYCEKCGTVAVPEKDLPVKLPYITDFKPRGAPPLENCPEFVNCTCPKCGAAAKRATETLDTFMCSSWYYLRYPFANRADVPFEKSVRAVDKYIGGAEHSCGHLIYARFITKFLHDKKYISFDEPFPSLVHQGMILAKDGTKMSKSRGNTVAPDDYVNKFGSDILRLFLMFGFNYTEGGPWNEDTLKTITKFTERVEKVVSSKFFEKSNPDLDFVKSNSIKSVRDDLNNFSFNTAVARCMELLNALEKSPTREGIETLVLLLAPMIPHIAEELWEMLGHAPSVFNHPFPTPNEKHLTRAEVEIAVQINSKIVARITVPSNAEQHFVEQKAREGLGEGTAPKKIIYIKNRLINFIVQS